MLLACYRVGLSFIQVKNVPPDLHEAVRRRAAEEGKTVSEYVRCLLEQELALPSRQAWLSSLADREAVDITSSTITNAIHAERRDE
jgi:plasmid stability protein